MTESLARLVGGTLPFSATGLLEFFRVGRSGTEGNWLETGHIQAIEALTGSRVLYWGYEWIEFKLPGASYTPDYFYCMETIAPVFVEVKGSKRQPNYRDARAKLRAAAALNPWATFYEAMPNKPSQMWEIERVEPDPDFIKALVHYGNS